MSAQPQWSLKNNVSLVAETRHVLIIFYFELMLFERTILNFSSKKTSRN